MSWRPITLLVALTVALAVPGTAHADDPPPPAVEPRAGTEAPAEVSGLAEPAAAGDPVAAAKAHLADPRYHLDPTDLVHLRTVKDGKDETVRFAQRYRNLPVLGGQYLVRFRTENGVRTVTGAGGRFLTELKVDPVPTVGAELAGRLAVATLVRDRTDRRTVKAGAGELVVVPRGAGVLAWRVPLSGVTAGRPFVRDAYVDARSGRPLFAVDRLHFAAPEGPVEASGATSDGREVTFPAFRRADGAHELRDRSRPMWNGTTGEILTYDAAGRDVTEFLGGGVPADAKLAESATARFGPQHTASGAVDAHWGAGQVYAFYRGLGRDGLDGAGGSMYSVVNVTFEGQPFANAFWDGTKMVYGGGGPDYHSFAAGLDVVGHEMTHGVITNSADLVYLGQSGAMNEGLADYFGNAVEVDALGVPMSDPDASLLGERLCKTLPPAQCAIRDLDDGRDATEDYIGVTVSLDGGGVHLNSTIFSGALWDIREKIGGAKADKLVYKALTEYMTPLDEFLDGRRAVESAARAAGLPARDRLAVALAFDRHGIKPGWDRRIRTDSRVVADGLTEAFFAPDLAGGRYVVMNNSASADEPSSVHTGRLRGGALVRLSQNAEWNYIPVTDGERAVWGSFDDAQTRFRILSRPLDGGAPETTVHETTGYLVQLAVEGDVVAWEEQDLATQRSEIWVKRGGAAPVLVTAAEDVTGVFPSLKDGRLGYVRVRGAERVPAVYDVASGRETVLPVPGSRAGMLVLTSRYAVWTHNEDGDYTAGLSRAGLDGTGVTTLVPDGPDAPMSYWLDAGDGYVTIAEQMGFGLTNDDLPKLFQLPIAGGELERVSCNRGDQYLFASGEDRQVLWLDGTAADTDLVTRHRPAGRC
ncbi:M4 family metallopeptidase [Nonomuraea sp. NPDC049725]|uniref:M4 family metallopeptidase n=1 Tax=Nonomuraea sp. NPDC049725 TaxID=3154508 RepID=UPI00344850F9